MYLADYFASSDIQRREQGDRTVRAACGTSLRDARCQLQHGLRAIECLNLARVVHAQRHGHEGPVHLKPNDISHLVDEHRIAGELELLICTES